MKLPPPGSWFKSLNFLFKPFNVILNIVWEWQRRMGRRGSPRQALLPHGYNNPSSRVAELFDQNIAS